MRASCAFEARADLAVTQGKALCISDDGHELLKSLLAGPKPGFLSTLTPLVTGLLLSFPSWLVMQQAGKLRCPSTTYPYPWFPQMAGCLDFGPVETPDPPDNSFHSGTATC